MKKILIIDDEPGFTDMVKLNLENTGRYEVYIENDPTRALGMIHYCKPDIILLDVIMPFQEGPDIIHQIKNDRELKSIPVIFLTATIRKEEAAVDNGRMGEHIFLAKPSSIEELINCIEAHILPPRGK